MVSTGRARVRSASWARHARAVAGGRNNPHRGFTIIELMIGVVLVAVLLGIGLPLFKSFILEQRLRATSSDLRVALTTARSEAITRNRVVKLKPSAGGWGAGWTIPNPTAGGADIFNHVQAGNVAIVGPTSADFTPAGRVVATSQFKIEVGDAQPGSKGCLEVGLDGRTDYCPGACPLERCASGSMKGECRCPVSRQQPDGTCATCP